MLISLLLAVLINRSIVGIVFFRAMFYMPVVSSFAAVSIILMSVWKNLGLNMVLYLAGLQSIPPNLYEAADIDGAGRVQKLLRITLPLLAPTT